MIYCAPGDYWDRMEALYLRNLAAMKLRYLLRTGHTGWQHRAKPCTRKKAQSFEGEFRLLMKSANGRKMHLSQSRSEDRKRHEARKCLTKKT